MARKFLTALDLAKNELQNAAVQSLASAPSSPVKFQLYGNTSDNTLYWYNGTSWVSATGGGTGFPGYGAVPAETTFGIAKSDGAATTVARSDHTHGTPTHDVAAHSTVPISALAMATANVNLNGFLITNVAYPSNASDAATKQYVDQGIQGLDAKASVRAATTGNITLSGLPQIIDGVTISVAGYRVLVKNQTAPAENGIYRVDAAAWTRTTDMDSWSDHTSAYVWVEEGTTQADTGWLCTVDLTGTLGTTPITWTQFSGAGQITAGAGLTKTGNTLDVGAGTGISVVADTVGFDTVWGDARYALVASGIKRYVGNVAAATSTAFAHNFNTRDGLVDVYRVASPYDTVDCDVERTDVNNVTVRFATVPSAGEYRVVIVG
jgi:hypothetical protein